MVIGRVLRRFGSLVSRESVDLGGEPYSKVYTPIATEEDILNCFRLLLGRSPEKKEWFGHKLSSGSNLQDVVGKFINSDEFKNRKLSVVSLADTAHEIVDLGRIKICISSVDEVCGLLRTAMVYEPGVTAIIERVLAPGMSFIDIGANIGYFSVLASSIVGGQGKVFCVEPYAYNIKMLQNNFKLNNCKNCEILPFALSDSKGFLSYDDSAGNSGNVMELGDEFASILKSTVVYSVRLDDIIPSCQKIDLIKMDIEGAEYLALKGMRKIISEQLPIIISEVSDGFLQRVSRVTMTEYLEALLENDLYQIAVIKNSEEIIPCGRDLSKVVEIYNGFDSMCMDVVVYTADKENLLRAR